MPHRWNCFPGTFPFGARIRFAFIMNRKFVPFSCPSWQVAAVLAGLGSVSHLSHAAEPAPATTNSQPAALEALVADVLEHNPELNFYRAEIAAAKGERRAAATWANPELSTSVGNKRVSGVGDGVAWSVTAQQTFEWPGRMPLRKAIANQQIK